MNRDITFVFIPGRLGCSIIGFIYYRAEYSRERYMRQQSGKTLGLGLQDKYVDIPRVNFLEMD